MGANHKSKGQNRRSRSVPATVEGVELLQARRNSMNLTRQELADRAGISLDTLERLIKRDKVDRDSVRKVVQVLDLQPTDIIDWGEWVGAPQPPSDEDEPGLPPAPIAGSSTEPEWPTGQVPLESAFYVERPPIESQCYQEIVYPGALIRIKAPRQMGKTSLMARILHQARSQGYRTTQLSLQSATSDVLNDIDKLMQWVCLCAGRGLRLPNQLDQYWDDIFDGNYNSTVYFENYLLAESSTPLVLGLDEVDRVFAYPEIANDFFGLLRAWYEKARYGDLDSAIWQKLRLIIIHSTEVYIPMNLNQSPFNVGLAIELPEFTVEQVQNLAQRHHLEWTTAQIAKLMALVGGHPYLVRLALYYVASQNTPLEQLLAQAPTESGIYREHLRRHLWNLEQYPELAAAFKHAVIADAPVSLNPILAFKLHSMGLVTIAENYVQPSCNLYRQYFYHRLGSR